LTVVFRAPFLQFWPFWILTPTLTGIPIQLHSEMQCLHWMSSSLWASNNVELLFLQAATKHSWYCVWHLSGFTRSTKENIVFLEYKHDPAWNCINNVHTKLQMLKRKTKRRKSRMLAEDSEEYDTCPENNGDDSAEYHRDESCHAADGHICAAWCYLEP